MKKYAFLSAAVLAITMSSFAQTDNVSANGSEASYSRTDKSSRQEKKEERRALRRESANEPSYFAEEAFYRDFGEQQNVSWRHEDGFDIASFQHNGQVESAFYDREAELVGTTTHSSFFDLPEPAQQYINKHYADYSVEGVVFFDDNENNETDMILFNRSFDDADNYFIELAKDGKKIVLQSDKRGNVQYFTDTK